MAHFTLPAAPAGWWRTARLVGLAGLGLVLVWVGATRLFADRALVAASAASRTVTVSTVRPEPGSAPSLSLPGRLEPWVEAPIYARTDGYIRARHADIGSRVRAGDILAEIDSPELDAQLSAARAALQVAQTQLDLATTTADRWRRLLEAGTVSRQAADEKIGDQAARLALRDQARAEVGRLTALVAFKRVRAPFDGVITSRAADPGALVIGNSAANAPLFTVVDDRRLRLYVSLPENRARVPAVGEGATFTVSDQAGRSFQATVVASAGAVEAASGSMRLQLAVDNADGALRPGAFARVVFNPMSDPQTGWIVPASALIFRQEGPAVALVDARSRIVIRPIAIAEDLGRSIVVSQGLTASDRVVDNPTSALATGQPVTVRPASVR